MGALDVYIIYIDIMSAFVFKYSEDYDNFVDEILYYFDQNEYFGDETWYYEVKNELINDYVTISDYEAKEVVSDYGAFKPIKEYKDEYGESVIDEKNEYKNDMTLHFFLINNYIMENHLSELEQSSVHLDRDEYDSDDSDENTDDNDNDNTTE